MTKRGSVVWAPDPFNAQEANPRPWLVISGSRMPYSDDESIAVALTTQSHHPGRIEVDDQDWVRGAPKRGSYVLPWTVATLKHDVHVVGMQGSVTDSFLERVREETISYLQNSPDH